MATSARGTHVAAAITFDELLRHNEEETGRWQEFFRQHADVLDLTIDIAQAEDVRGMLVHIFAVELLYTERLQGITRPKISPADFPSGSVDEVFSTGAKAREKFRELLARYGDEDWEKVVTFQTLTSGGMSATRRKMFAHAMLHSMRHWAQLATELRQDGLKQDWPHDFIFSKAIE